MIQHSYKRTLTLFFFFTTCTFITLYSQFQNWSVSSYFKDLVNNETTVSARKSYFKQLDYFYLKNGAPYLELKALGMTIDTIGNQEEGYLIAPNGHLFTKDQKQVFYKAKNGHYSKIPEFFHLKNEVELVSDESVINSNSLHYNLKTDLVLAEDEDKVKTKSLDPGTLDQIFISSKKLEFYPQKKISFYKEEVEGHIERKKKYEKDIFFKSKELSLNLLAREIKLKENVMIHRGEVMAYSKLGEIYLDNYNKKLKYYVLEDDVKIVERIKVGPNFLERKAFAERLDGYPNDEKIILTGFPKVYQDGDLIKGNKITLRENTEVVEVDDANTKFKIK